MGGPCRGCVLDEGIAQGRKIHTLEEALTGAEQDGRYGDVHLVNQALGTEAAMRTLTTNSN